MRQLKESEQLKESGTEFDQYEYTGDLSELINRIIADQSVVETPALPTSASQVEEEVGPTGLEEEAGQLVEQVRGQLENVGAERQAGGWQVPSVKLVVPVLLVLVVVLLFLGYMVC